MLPMLLSSGHQIHYFADNYALTLTVVEAEMDRAVYMTRTAKVMIASVEGAMAEIVGVVLLLPGYGLSYPSASAAFVSVHSSR